MKTTLLSILLFTSILVRAQYTDTHFGIKAGLNVSSLDEKNGVDFNSKAGLYLGGLAHVHLSPHFAVQPELVYSQQGGKDGSTGDLWRINYLNIPVLLQYMAGNGFRLETGPQVGFVVSSKIKSGDIEQDISSSVSKVDFSWALGASYQFPEGLGVDARYNIGISNVNSADDPVIKNRVFQLGLFYQFMNSTTHSRTK
jgi:opacity protein-like surface antigen